MSVQKQISSFKDAPPYVTAPNNNTVGWFMNNYVEKAQVLARAIKIKTENWG